MSPTSLKLEKSASKMSYTRQRNFFSQAFQTGLALLRPLFILAKTRRLWKVHARLGILSKLLCPLVPEMTLTTIRVWKQVHAACLEKSEFRLVSFHHIWMVFTLDLSSIGSNLWSQHCCPCGRTFWVDSRLRTSRPLRGNHFSSRGCSKLRESTRKSTSCHPVDIGTHS